MATPNSQTPPTNPSTPSSNSQPQDPSKPLSLPALPEAPTSDSSTPQTLEVNGSALRLDHMGPLVVNEDGTMSRIANWDKMAEIEKENALRILGKRNKMRLEKLRAAATPGEGSNSPAETNGESKKGA
ncbi:hypothetical protein F5Y16DRAFT_398745 [Xylariaceae sp. FL0255]|nr:hypothetical protein F5Y16DRAFT_398745 [Xylariaceae sp. FL0255]